MIRIVLLATALVSVCLASTPTGVAPEEVCISGGSTNPACQIVHDQIEHYGEIIEACFDGGTDVCGNGGP